MYGLSHNIANLINNISTFYEMSDDHRIFEENERIKKKVESKLKYLVPFEISHIPEFLNSTGKVNLQRYFGNILQV